MRKKEKSSIIIKKKETQKKIKEPKDYIPPQLLTNLREYNLINSKLFQNTEEIEKNKNNQNYSSNYKPEFIPCKIAEEWNYKDENEINADIFTNEEIMFYTKKDIDDSNIQKNNSSENLINENNDNSKNETNAEYLKKLNNLIKLDDDSDMFNDPEEQIIKDNLPLYLIDIFNNEIKWKRPYQYIFQYYLWEKAKILYPKKKQTVICKEIIETYKDYLRKLINGEIAQESGDEKDVNDYLSKEIETIKSRIYKEFYPIIDKKYIIKVCDYISRLETEEEYQKRKELELKEINIIKKGKTSNLAKNIKNIKKNSSFIDFSDKKMIKVLKISNLMLNTKSNNCNSFYTWITSILQFIIDNKINDINTKKSILYNIYPQKDGIPIYNPK